MLVDFIGLVIYNMTNAIFTPFRQNYQKALPKI